MNNKLLNMILEEEEDAQYPQDYVFYADLWNAEQQGYLLSYDGNDYCSKAVANYRSGDNAGSIEGWVKTTVTGTKKKILSSADIGTTGTSIIISISATTGLLTIFQRDNGDTGDQLKGATNIGDARWHYYAVTTNG